MPGLSVYTENALLEYLDDTLVATPFISVHTGAVGTTGANEASGGGYARIAVTWGAASAGSMTNTNTVTVTVAAGTYTDFGVWDAVTTGNWIGGHTMSASQVLAAPGTIVFAPGQLTFALTA